MYQSAFKSVSASTLTKSTLIAAVVAAGIALLLAAPLEAQQQQSAAKAKMSQIPEGACVTSTGHIENGRTCAGTPNELQWAPVQWCVQGQLQATLAACWEPSGVCEPKC